MASESLGSAYVLTSEGVAQLVAMASKSAPVSTPGFTSRYSGETPARLSALQELVKHRATES